MWNSGDPRLEVDKHRTVVVSDGTYAFRAAVETNHGWHVDVEGVMGGQTFIMEAEEWPANWYWADLPQVGKDV